MVLPAVSWWPLFPWLSPAAAWFIFFNAVVGAIVIMHMSTSGAGAQAGHGRARAKLSSSRRRLCRSGPSIMVLDRLQSFFVFPVHHVAAGGITGPLPIDDTDDDSSAAASASHCYYCCCSREAEVVEPTTQVCATEPNTQAGTATTSLTAAIGNARPSGALALETAEDAKAEADAEEEQEQDHESITLDEAYALAQRHRVQSPPPAEASTAAAAKATPTDHKKKPAKVAVADWRRVSEAGEALEGKAELNARAELFIRQFREDLKLQRLNSILRHTHALGSPTAAR